MFVSDGNVVYASHLDTETFQLVTMKELSATLKQAQRTKLLRRQAKLWSNVGRNSELDVPVQEGYL